MGRFQLESDSRRYVLNLVWSLTGLTASARISISLSGLSDNNPLLALLNICKHLELVLLILHVNSLLFRLKKSWRPFSKTHQPKKSFCLLSFVIKLSRQNFEFYLVWLWESLDLDLYRCQVGLQAPGCWRCEAMIKMSLSSFCCIGSTSVFEATHRQRLQKHRALWVRDRCWHLLAGDYSRRAWQNAVNWR